MKAGLKQVEEEVNKKVNETKYQITKKMLSEKIPLKTISEITGLTIEEIKNLK